MKKNIKFIIVLIIIGLFLWFLGIYPIFKFKGYENSLKKASIRYYDANYNMLPYGNSVGVLKLNELYSSGFLKEDLYVPYSKKLCSVNKSWVKVKKDKKGNYKYYPYLECGVFKSNVDHVGPTIKLKGDSTITLNRGDSYKEFGVLSVKDDKDGKLDINKVKIDSSQINTNINGSYKVKYSVYDSFLNESIVYRNVNVKQKLNDTIKKESTNGTYMGNVYNNYFRFSGVLYRIIGFDKNNNVKIVTSDNISNVNYDSIDEWLDYYYDNIASTAKKYLVKNKYCTGTIDENTINTDKRCLNNTKSKYISILSNYEVNNSLRDGDSYIFTPNISWVSNDNNKDIGWTISKNYPITDSKYFGLSKDYNFGIRPLLTIKGNSYIIGGDGSKDNPYVINDLKKAKAGEYLNTRYSGEYVTYSAYKFRIINNSKNGNIKVVSTVPIDLQDNNKIGYLTDNDIKIYNPLEKGNIGYLINKFAGDTLNEKYFVSETIEVPIYKTIAKYKKEIETKKYKVKFSAPDMYDMFTASRGINYKPYWLLNSSREKYRKYYISNNGVVMYTPVEKKIYNYVRVVGYLNKNIRIVSGDGTENSPYKIKL